jgi:hypothetical protein
VSRYRKIEVCTWADSKFRSLSPINPCAQGLWLFFLSGPYTGPIPGLFRAGRAALAEELGWELEEFDEAFREIVEKGMAKSDFRSRLVWLPNAFRHNPPSNPNVVKSWRTELAVLPECPLKEEAALALQKFLAELGGNFLEAFLGKDSSDLPKEASNHSANGSGNHSANGSGNGLLNGSTNGSEGSVRNGSVNGLANQEQEQEQEQEAGTGSSRKQEEILAPRALDLPAEAVTLGPPKKSEITAEGFLQAWNANRGVLSKATMLTEERRAKIGARTAKGLTLERFTTAVKLCAASHFCTGGSDRGWRADFDWLIKNDGTIVKVLEGRYSNALHSDFSADGGTDPNGENSPPPFEHRSTIRPISGLLKQVTQ